MWYIALLCSFLCVLTLLGAEAIREDSKPPIDVLDNFYRLVAAAKLLEQLGTTVPPQTHRQTRHILEQSPPLYEVVDREHPLIPPKQQRFIVQGNNIKRANAENPAVKLHTEWSSRKRRRCRMKTSFSLQHHLHDARNLSNTEIWMERFAKDSKLWQDKFHWRTTVSVTRDGTANADCMFFESGPPYLCPLMVRNLEASTWLVFSADCLREQLSAAATICAPFAQHTWLHLTATSVEKMSWRECKVYQENHDAAAVHLVIEVPALQPHTYRNKRQTTSTPRRVQTRVVECAEMWDRNSIRALDANGVSGGLMPCCQRKIEIDFAALGWQNWILSPRRFNTSYCLGRCVGFGGMGAEGQHVLYTQIMQAYDEVVRLGKSPCCSPTKFSPITITVREGSEMITQTLDNAIVEECGCM